MRGRFHLTGDGHEVAVLWLLLEDDGPLMRVALRMMNALLVMISMLLVIGELLMTGTDHVRGGRRGRPRDVNVVLGCSLLRRRLRSSLSAVRRAGRQGRTNWRQGLLRI